MNRRSSNLVAMLSGAALLASVAAGCDKSADTKQAPEAVSPQAAASGSESPPEEAAPKSLCDKRSSAPAHQNRYAVESPSGKIPVGKKQKVELVIKPASGLKINDEFPWKLEVCDAQGVQLARKAFAKKDIELAEKAATVPVFVEAGAEGPHKLQVAGDFSVCTDKECYVIRNEPLAFNLEATAAAGGSEPASPE